MYPTETESRKINQVDQKIRQWRTYNLTEIIFSYSVQNKKKISPKYKVLGKRIGLFNILDNWSIGFFSICT